MTGYEFGDVLLFNAFPYSSLQGEKRRPALVLADTGDLDLVVCRITSEAPRDSFDLPLSSWKESGLLLSSCIRASKMATLSRRLVVKKLGRLGSPDRRRVRTSLKRLFGL